MYEWNPNKARINLAQHGVAFEAAYGFDWEAAVECRDARFPYPEVRTIAMSLIGDRLHVMVFARRAQAIRIISLRKANVREIKSYVAFNR